MKKFVLGMLAGAAVTKVIDNVIEPKLGLENKVKNLIIKKL